MSSRDVADEKAHTLLANSRRVLESVLGVNEEESVAILADEGVLGIGLRFFRSAREITRNAVLMLIPVMGETSAEPAELAARALLNCDVYVGISSVGSKSITHTRARREASEAGARGLTLPGMTEEMLARKAVGADYQAIAKATDALAKRLNGTNEIVIRSAGGSDLTFDVHGGTWFAEQGLCLKAGRFSNLPGGEVSIAPVDAEGVLVVDGSISVLGKLSSPLVVRISGRRIVSIEGDRASVLRGFLEGFGPDAFNVAEIGIGMNPDARVTGEVLEDEKVLGTIHVGFGDSSNMGGTTLGKTVAVAVHIDGVVVSEPQLIADDAVVDPKEFFGTNEID